MSNDSIVGFTAFSIIFILEYFFPFFKFPGFRVKHAVTNLGVALINTLIVFAFAEFLMVCIDCFNQKFYGLLTIFNNSITLKIVFAVILFDLWMYAWHRMNHEIYFLWRFHRMHHTDPSMDSTTAVRFHPVELVISYLFNIAVLVLLGLNFAFLAIYKTIMFPIIIFHHSNVSFSERLYKLFNYLFVMPNMHRVHHSEKMHETNSNYGSIFSFWDRLFGTFRKREDIEAITYGIGAFKSAKWQNIFGMLLLPFR